MPRAPSHAWLFAPTGAGFSNLAGVSTSSGTRCLVLRGTSLDSKPGPRWQGNWFLDGKQRSPQSTGFRCPSPCSKLWLCWLGFRLLAGVTLLSFYGLGRIGEVLPTLRSDLLLPVSKTMMRMRSRVQHIRIEDPKAVELLEAVFRNLPNKSDFTR